jgi:Fuc2NAc and GlcNAc transferase
MLAMLLSGTALLAALGTGAVRRLALAHALLDIPNDRSSHRVATPRGGGLAVVLTVTAVAVGLRLAGALPPALLWALLGGLVVAAVGFADDRNSVRPVVRLAAHFGAGLWAAYWMGGMPALQFGAYVTQPGVFGYLIAVLIVVWTLNLFNFMDGIDGLAASEAIFIAGAGALLLARAGGISPTVTLSLVLVAACAGFLLWNWPPARIFLGDVGSGYIGYVLSVLALAAGHQNPVNPWLWLLLGAGFFVDATVTLVRRFLRGQRLHEAHRSHAYQHLAQRLGRHLPVTLGYLLVNLLVLLPCALLAQRAPQHAAALTCGVLLLLALAALLLGAGRAGPPDTGAS